MIDSIWYLIIASSAGLLLLILYWQVYKIHMNEETPEEQVLGEKQDEE